MYLFHIGQQLAGKKFSNNSFHSTQ